MNCVKHSRFGINVVGWMNELVNEAINVDRESEDVLSLGYHMYTGWN